MTDELRRIDGYLDAVARAATRSEPIGPFTLFVNEGPGWPYYARPTLGSLTVTSGDVASVRERQRELEVPESFEWIDDIAPEATGAIRDAGLEVTLRPLMALGQGDLRTVPSPDGSELRFLDADDSDLVRAMAVQHLGFGEPGTRIGHAGAEALAAVAAGIDDAHVALLRERLGADLTRMAGIWIDGDPVAAGAHQPLAQASEVVGVATLPALRRRGLGAALSEALARDAFALGCDLLCLSASDDAVAGVYGRIGFARVGTFADARTYQV